MDFKFDLQMFTTLDLSSFQVGANGNTASGSKGWINSAGNISLVTIEGALGTVEFNSSYSVTRTGGSATGAATNVKSITLTGSVDLNVTPVENSIKVTDKAETANKLALGGTDHEFNAAEATIKNGKLTAGKDVGLVDAADTIGLDNFTGNVKDVNNNDALIGTFSNVTATLGEATVGSFSKGTINTADGSSKVSIEGGVLEAGKSVVTGGDTIKWVLGGTAQVLGMTSVTDTKSFNVVGTAGADTITGIGNQGANITVDGGAGNDVLQLAGHKALISVTGGAGNDSIFGNAATTIHENSTILGGAGKDTIDFIDDTATNLVIDGGADADAIILGADVTLSTVKGGDGDDKITSEDASNLIYGGKGADTFVLSDSLTGSPYNANIQDYKFGEDLLGIVGTNAAVTAANSFDGKLTSDGNNGYIADSTTYGNATVGATGSFFAVTLVDEKNNKANVGWVGDTASKVDASSQNISTVIYGTTNTEGDTLIGGKKNDTIYAGAGDSVYGGAGADTVQITAGAAGVFVGLSTAGGSDEVQNYTAGWDTSSADAVLMMDGTAANLSGSYDGTGATLKSGSAKLTFTSLTGNGTDDVKVLINGKKVDAIKEGSQLSVSDSDTLADYYFGTKASGINMTDYSADVKVDLSNEMFRNITTVQAGSGNVSLLGGKAAESLKGGTGATSLYGGAGKDTLVSGDGKTTFFADSASGKDVVTDFVVGTEDNSDVLNLSGFKNITRSENNAFTVNVDDSNGLVVTQKDGDVNSNIQWVSGSSKGVAKIGLTASENSFVFDNTVTNYFGGNKADTVAVASGSTDSFNVWLDKTGGLFTSVEAYDFSQTSGDVLAAGKASVSETIVGGQGNNSLWGGSGNTVDLLINNNSSATTKFFYGLGDGNDHIIGQENDSVELYNISLSQVTGNTINDNNVVFTTTAGNTVTVEGATTFTLSDGSSWKVDYSSKEWTQK